eukprot:TRINITY_DN116_c0_g1_i3.p1 TRINITY_DN116_c0_g1~~TRINITY_DN116_c0_g1_i3.p1  ORF type:complete len:495 (-),score=39.14 TRINITY_DN116_c0_g1_i3:294-1778(-)
MGPSHALHIAASISVATLLLATVSVSGLHFTYPGCDADMCAALDDPSYNNTYHPAYSDYFVNGASKTFMGEYVTHRGDYVSTTSGWANLACFAIPVGGYDGTVAVSPFTNLKDVRDAVYAYDGMIYLAYLGQFSKVSGCCNACNAYDGCVYWRYLNQGHCYMVNSNLTLKHTWDAGQTGYNIAYKFAEWKPKLGAYYCGFPLTVVGGTCRQVVASVNEDPHLVGAEGTKFDFSGVLAKSFCLLSDESLHVNMLLDGYFDKRIKFAKAGKKETGHRSWIKELGIIYKSGGEEHKLHLVARKGKETSREKDGFVAAINVDNAPVELPKVGERLELSKGAVLWFSRVEEIGTLQVDSYELILDGLARISIKVRVAHPALHTAEDAHVHFNIGMRRLQTTPNVHGVLGQTYRQGRDRVQRATKYKAINNLLGRSFHADKEEGKGFLDGKPEDYVSSHVMATDCAFSAFKKSGKAPDTLGMLDGDHENVRAASLANQSA